MEAPQILDCMNACGFQSELRKRYLAYAKSGQTKAQIRLLGQQRKLLMDRLHTLQRQVDCIDFIICGLERSDETP